MSQFWQLCIFGFLFGVGAAGAYPNAAGVISRWFPRRERARARDSSGVRVVWGAGSADACAVAGIVRMAPCLLDIGLCGAGVAVVWHAWFRDPPPNNRESLGWSWMSSVRPRTISRSVPWRKILAEAALVGRICLFLLRVGELVLFWLVPYMDGTRGAISLSRMGVFASLPFILAMAGIS